MRLFLIWPGRLLSLKPSSRALLVNKLCIVLDFIAAFGAQDAPCVLFSYLFLFFGILLSVFKGSGPDGVVQSPRGFVKCHLSYLVNTQRMYA